MPPLNRMSLGNTVSVSVRPTPRLVAGTLSPADLRDRVERAGHRRLLGRHARHRRADPAVAARNINRFYVPSLFGDWTVMREWGRRGSPGTMRFSSFARRNEAESAEQRTIKRRLQRGYRLSEEPTAAPLLTSSMG
jgi:predicted DNA-binding WGR domain protein